MKEQSRFVTPKVYWIGFTEIRDDAINQYLDDTGNADFRISVQEARSQGLSNAEILCSFFAKLCYKALSLGKNSNVSRVRDIPSNLEACFNHGHGSVLEHVQFNFVIADCSRIFTHELVRHRIGTAFSQTSGRYCRLDSIPIVWDPVLDPVKELWASQLDSTEATVYLTECKLGLRKPPESRPDAPADFYFGECVLGNGQTEAALAGKWVPDDSFDFTKRKQITSAIRRIAPNGQANEIGFSCNLRSLRHMIMMRTGRFAEWEIRVVFEQIYLLLKEHYPMIFYGAKEEVVDGIIEVSGMQMQPYDKTAEMVLSEMTDEQIEAYLESRRNG